MKKLFLLILSVIISLSSLVLFSACSEKGTDGLHYQKISGKEEYQVIGIGTASELDIIIPNKYNGLPVTKIADSAFKGCANIESVHISGNVEIVGDWAFAECKSLRKVSFSKGTKIVGDRAFSECKNLSEVNFPDGLEKIESTVFVDCTSLKSIHIPNSVEEIGSQLFHGCTNLNEIVLSNKITKIPHGIFYKCEKLNSIDIPESVTIIENSAFMYCKGLEELTLGKEIDLIESGSTFLGCEKLTVINVSEENLKYISIDGILYDKQKTTLIQYPMNKKDNSYIMPDTISEACEYSMYGNKFLEKISLSKTLTRIGPRALGDIENITELTIPASVTIIGPGAFLGCTKLNSLLFETPDGWGKHETEDKKFCSISGSNFSDPKQAVYRFVESEKNIPGWWIRDTK